MKKAFLCAVAMLATLALNAQISVGNIREDAEVVERNTSVKVLPKQWNNRFAEIPAPKHMKKTPVLGENERLIGLYTTDDYTENGLGLPNNPGSYTIFTYIPAQYYNKLRDVEVKRLRFALAQACNVTSVDILEWRKDGYIYNGVSQALTTTGCSAGWNEVTLDAPYVINPDINGILIGYTYQQVAGAYPMSMVSGTVNSELSFGLLGDLGEGTQIYDLSEYGMLSAQAIVGFAGMPTVDLVIENFEVSDKIIATGSQLGYAFNMYNYGTETVSDYQINVTLDGNVIETVTSPALTATVVDHIQYYTIPETLARGQHTLAVEVVSVNGVAPTDGLEDDKASATFTSIKAGDVVARQKHFVEEYTSNSCTYCPYGGLIMDKLHELRPDDLVLVAVHGNQSAKDPFNTQECQNILAYMGVSGFPSASFNRIWLGAEDGVCPSIGYNPQYTNQAAQMFLDIMDSYSSPAFASVEIAKQLEGDELTLTVSGKGGEVAQDILSGYSLTVYITEDNLVYRQLNLGTWDRNYVHNHVLRDCVTAVNGDAIQWKNASEYENTYTVSLDSTWVKDNIQIVAFISKQQPLNAVDWSDMAVSNANSVKLTESSVDPNPDNGEDHRAEANLKLSPMSGQVQMMGEAMSADTKYVAGLNYSTFAPAIWNTETNEIVNYPQYEEGAFHAVNCAGTAVGDDGIGDGRAIALKLDGTLIPLYFNVGDSVYNAEFDFWYCTGDAGSSAWCISEDGKTIGGSYFSSSYQTWPCIWNENGERTTLPIPTSSEAYFDGAQVRYMTPDARLLLGYASDNFSTWPAVLWRLNEAGTYDVEFLAKDFWVDHYTQTNKYYMVFNPSGISANGEWVSLLVQAEYDDWDFSKEPPVTQAARLHLPTGKLEVITMPEPYQDQPMQPTGIANDGTMLMYTIIDGLFGRVGYVMPAGEGSVPQCLDDQLAACKGMVELGANTPCSISADGKKIQGFGISSDTDIFSYVFDVEAYLNDLPMAPAAIETISNDRIFNLQGQQLRSMEGHGLFLINGKKILK